MAIPKFKVYTSDKTSPRSFNWLWFLRLPAIVFTIIVLGLTAGNYSTFNNSGCSPPSKLSFNIAVAVISFVCLIYLLLAAGPSPKVRLLPWLIWGQLALDAFLFILWLAAASSSRYNCNDLCNACDGYSELYYDKLYCFCYSNYYKRDQSPAPRGLLQARKPSRYVSSDTSDSSSGYASTADARKAFDALATVIFFLCVAADLLWIFQASRSSSTSTAPAPAGSAPPAKQEEAGISSSGPGGPLNNQPAAGANTEYSGGQPMQQQQGGCPQQPMTQTQYPEAQHPPQYSQGQPQQPYPQTYSPPPQQQQQQGYSQQPYTQTYSPPPQQQYPHTYSPPPQGQHELGQQHNYVAPKEGAAEVHSPSLH